MPANPELTARLSFVGDLQIAWDSTSLRTFQSCPRKYYYSVVQGYSPRAESVHLTFGIHYHKAMERYHHGRAKLLGGTGDAGTSGTVRQNLSDAEHTALVEDVFHQTLIDTIGWHSDDRYKNRGTLLRSIVWALDEYRDDPAETVILANGAPAVELSFRFELPIARPDGDPYLYCGHLDRVARFNGELYVFDYKSTKWQLNDQYWAGFNPNNQMTGYTYGAKVTQALPVRGVIIEACQVLIEGSRFGRRPTARNEAQLEEWMLNTTHSIKLAETYAKADFWPMNLESCGSYGGCQFRHICGKSPKQRDAWLKSDFHLRIWDPLQIRGDI